MALYGLIGYPLGHSFSKAFFTEKFEREHINAEYLNFELPDIGDLMEVLSEYPQLRGFNVTIPYKQQVMAYLAEIDPVAEAIGAVNVVKIAQTPSGPQLSGFNSDVVGFTESLSPMLNPEATRGLVLGNGGAAKAVVYGLRSLGIEPTIVSRTPAEGQL
ncbi:MAG: shikimate dehydrogenase, partial [Muribaculaceae bacterium]|nr:shikimate dehydrogenase [Muribaculaceae bacterium]